jgi:GST-like protein
MSSSGSKKDYVWSPPDRVEELYESVLKGNKFASLNRPTAGERSGESLPEGNSDIQLYSLATPNGQKVGILLEELNKVLGVEYDAHTIRINGLQFSKGFVEVNPNSKIPCLVDKNPEDGCGNLRVFESGSIMIYLADKYKQFIPKGPRGRAECISWVMWQMGGQGPITGGCYGHFMVYAPPSLNRDYGVARYGMEVQRLCSVLDNHFSDGRTYICGDEYTIADMICLPWFHIIRTVGYVHSSGVATKDFLNIAQYKYANRWADMLCDRPTVMRGLLVCRGEGKPWLANGRHKHLAKM